VITPDILRLGTRRSALARAQSGLMARALEAQHAGLRVELVGIDTRGDQILDKPLTAVDGKEFFTAELDQALLRGDVDCTVHSFKDLALERPAALLLAAVPRRENPRDIALFAADVPERLAAGAPLSVGSSSPRRAAFVPEFLQSALPGGNARVELCELRGNVDSRLRRLHEPRGSARQLDGVVLAFAGLARLWQDEAGRALLTELLPGLPRMLLPLTAVPTAPAQAALAVECRADDTRVIELLAALDDGATRRAVSEERQLLAVRGGGCHQRFGATQIAVPGLGSLLYVRDAAEHTQLRWHPTATLPDCGDVKNVWDGSLAQPGESRALASAAEHCATGLLKHRACFIAHRRALPAFDESLRATQLGPTAHIWAPGAETWFALSGRGVWVEGCAEGLGFDSLAETLKEPVLQLPGLNEWLALTHADALKAWIAAGPVALATYRHERVAADGVTMNAAQPSPLSASHVYWHSAAQFDRWNGNRRVVGAMAHHACAFGKTADHLRAAGVSQLTVFPSVVQWREWLQQ
jgi:hydroxymethylbilane synthase